MTPGNSVTASLFFTVRRDVKENKINIERVRLRRDSEPKLDIATLDKPDEVDAWLDGADLTENMLDEINIKQWE